MKGKRSTYSVAYAPRGGSGYDWVLGVGQHKTSADAASAAALLTKLAHRGRVYVRRHEPRSGTYLHAIVTARGVRKFNPLKYRTRKTK